MVVPLFDRSRFGVPERFRTHPLFTTPHCGVNFGFLARRGYFSRPEVRRQPVLHCAGYGQCVFIGRRRSYAGVAGWAA